MEHRFKRISLTPDCSSCVDFFVDYPLAHGANVIRNCIRTSKLTASRSCAAAGTSIKGLRLESRQSKARAARHYMVISCGNLPGELYHGRAWQTMPACPLGTKYHHHGGGTRVAVRVGLDGGDITKMSENVTHLIIYAPRSRRYPRSSLSLPLSSFSLALFLLRTSRAFSGLLHPHFTTPVPASARPTLRVQCRRRILARN